MDLTSKEKGSGVGVVLLCFFGMAGMLTGLSLLGHTSVVPPAHPAPKGPHGPHTPPPKAPPPVVENRPVTSPLSWVAMIPTLGLSRLPWFVALIVGGVIGLLYGLEAALLASYDLTGPLHWWLLFLDLTWSLPNTIFGFVLGNPFYMIKGEFSRDQSRAQAWISFKGSLGAADQTLGTLNLGGAGAHEPVHVLQARILGPAFIPLQLLSYIVLGLIQILFTILIGWILKLAKVRDSAWFRPSRDSVLKSPEGDSGIKDFFGWIYRYTLMELWAYATQ